MLVPVLAALVYAAHGNGRIQWTDVEDNVVESSHGQLDQRQALSMLLLAIRHNIKTRNGIHSESLSRQYQRYGRPKAQTGASFQRAVKAKKAKGPTKFDVKKLANLTTTIVEVLPTKTEKSSRLDVEDISRALRRSGAYAVAISEDWLDQVVEEQARGPNEDMKQPLPILCIPKELQPESLSDLHDRGASGVVMYTDSSSAVDNLPSVVAQVEEKGMALVVVAEDDASAEAARAAGAHVVACPNPLPDSEGSSSVLLGTWDGKLETLMKNRGEGFDSSLLLDGSGPLTLGTYKWFEEALGPAKLKRSGRVSSEFWGGSEERIDLTGLGESDYDERNNPGFVKEVESFPGQRKKEDGFSREYPTLPDQFIR
jgi:hypothetical protein